ncbi:MAG: DUF4446 family protein [Patescibacteria group bacterium]
MLFNTTIGLLAVTIVWLIVLSFFLFQSVNHYKKLLGKTKDADLRKILEEVLSSETKNQKDIKNIFNQIDILKREGLNHIQKLGLVRYNPFNDTGGDHSFSLSVLDGVGNGFVLTGLHTRDRTRFYIKSIKEGKANKELSREEIRAVELASKS